MMYIVTNSGMDEQWHIGERRPDITPSHVTEVQADGDELTYIGERFTNLPVDRLGSVVRWFGDHAKFIVSNL